MNKLQAAATNVLYTCTLIGPVLIENRSIDVRHFSIHTIDLYIEWFFVDDVDFMARLLIHTR